MKRLSFILFALALQACSGTIYTVQSPKFVDGVTEGVLFHGYRMETVKTVLDRIRQSKTGEITHSMYEDPSSPRFCTPRVKETKVAVADYSTQYAIRYKPALFESNKFAVELDKGTLQSVNSESVPGPAAAVESLQGLAGVREDILDGVTKAAEAADDKALQSILGIAPARTPITCTASE